MIVPRSDRVLQSANSLGQIRIASRQNPANPISNDRKNGGYDTQHNDNRQKRARGDYGNIQQEHRSLLDEEKIALIEQSRDAQEVEMRTGHQVTQRVENCTDACKCAGQPAAERCDTFKKGHCEGSLALLACSSSALRKTSQVRLSAIGKVLNRLMDYETPRAG